MKSPAAPALTLPPVATFRQACALANAWSDHYGAVPVAAAYAGVLLHPRYELRGIWMHGCGGPWLESLPESLYCNSPMARTWPVFVARPDEEALLRAHGCPRVRAIGLPIGYTPDPGVARLPDSLLIVPTHTLVGDQFHDRAAFERYADEMAAIAPRYRRVVACIHPNCQRNGLWIREFTSRGIEVVLGAQTNDRNALLRMRTLFAQFETVTTNGWGGHVAYALAFGARVSIHGTLPERSRADLERDESWAANKATLQTMLSAEVQAKREEFLRPFRCPPAEAVADVDRGRWLIGWDQRLSPEAMREVLAELVDPVPVPASAAPRRILFVSHEASRTGAPMFLLHLLRWLRAHTRLEFDVLLGRGGPLQEQFAAVATVREPKDFTTQPGLIREYALVYANTICNGALLDEIGTGAVPVVTHVHELDMGYHWTGARNVARVIRQSARYVACADTVARRLHELFGLPEAGISVHYEMVDPACVQAPADAALAALRREHDLPPDALIVTACGTLDLRKSPDLFLQVAARLKRQLAGARPLRCLWIGATNNPDLAQLLRGDARKLGLEDEVRFINELPSPHGLMALSQAFCLTSREDPFPLVMLEAALLGRPVLAFAGAGGAGEFCALGGGETVPYLDTTAMADRVLALAADPAAAAALGQRASALVRERFTPAAIAPGLARELEGWLAQPPAAPPERDPAVSWADLYRRWQPGHWPQPVYVAAHLARDDARRRARELVATHRRREAVQLLVKTVSTDLATRNPAVILESLVEIAVDLDPLDPRQAAALRDKARTVAASTGLRVEGLPAAPAAAA